MIQPEETAESALLRKVAHDLANTAYVLKLALETMQEYPPEKEMYETVKAALDEESVTVRKSVESLRSLYRPSTVSSHLSGN